MSWQHVGMVAQRVVADLAERIEQQKSVAHDAPAIKRSGGRATGPLRQDVTSTAGAAA
jgi:hypothetical protein